MTVTVMAPTSPEIAAAGTNNSTGIASVAPDSPLLIMKIDNDIIGWENFRIQSAINSAHAAGAKIINVSGGVVQALSEPVCSAVSGTPGALVVGAAGNYNPGGAFPDIFKTAVQFPARCTGALAVGAVMPSASGWTVLNASGLASVEGPDVEIVAPGLNIRSSKPGNSHGNRTGTSFHATPWSPARLQCSALKVCRFRISNQDNLQRQRCQFPRQGAHAGSVQSFVPFLRPTRLRRCPGRLQRMRNRPFLLPAWCWSRHPRSPARKAREPYYV